MFQDKSRNKFGMTGCQEVWALNDFEILLKHFVKLKKKVLIFANAKGTAKELKILKGIQVNNFLSLRSVLEFKVRDK